MTEATPLPVVVAPDRAPWIDAAVVAGGAELLRAPDAGRARALVWTDPGDAAPLAELVAAHPHLEWIQLPWAGIEPFRHLLDKERIWTCAKGVYADPVAEHALALLLAGFRNLGAYARATTWTGDVGRNLFGARVVILGGGGIAEKLAELLAPFRCTVTVVRRSERPVPGVDHVVGPDRLHEALDGAEALVLALPLVPETTGIVGAAELALLAPGAWVVNVARGAHIRTDDLVDALRAGRLGGAALDVTDPEPLPDGHPLWSLPNVIITPHVGNTREMAKPLLAARVTDNVARFAAGRDLVGLVDPDLGY